MMCLSQQPESNFQRAAAASLDPSMQKTVAAAGAAAACLFSPVSTELACDISHSTRSQKIICLIKLAASAASPMTKCRVAHLPGHCLCQAVACAFPCSLVIGEAELERLF